jgi:hypothetical protein
MEMSPDYVYDAARLALNAAPLPGSVFAWEVTEEEKTHADSIIFNGNRPGFRSC